MKHVQRLILTGTAILSVSACSSGGSGSGASVAISPAEELTRTFAQVDPNDPTNVQDAGGAIANGETLTARSVSVAGQRLNYGNGETNLADAAVSVRRNADGELSVTLNGVEQAFTAADRVIEPDGTFGYEIRDDVNSVYVGAFNMTGEIDEFLNPGNGYLEVLSVSSNQVSVPGGGDLRAYAVLGAETRDAALANLPTATYNGRARLDAVPNTGFVNNPTSRTRIRGDVELTANFGAGTIGGTLSDITTEAGGSPETALAGSVAMNTANFDVNGFRSSITGDSTLAASGLTINSGSTYSGAFYGPNAEEVGGVFNATGNYEGQGYNALGFFRANKN